jgi:hypothetical protein
MTLRIPAIRRNQAGLRKAKSASIPACIGGWNSSSPLASMAATDAVVLENWFPKAYDVTTRLGAVRFSSLVSEQLYSAHVWEGGSSRKVFAAGSSLIWDVTSFGSAVSTGQASSSLFSSSANFSTLGGHFLVFVNGADPLRLFNGTTWQAITAVSVPAITGVSSSSLTSVAVIKRKLWFTVSGSSSAYYLPTAAIAGALQEFPLGQVFSRGGYLSGIANWTVDGGSGSDDYTVFASSAGEVAVYRGSDPATDFSLIGVFFLGVPLSLTPFTRYGGDLLYLCQGGLLPLSRSLQSTVVDRSQALTAKIDPSFAEALSSYGHLPNWSVCVYPDGNFLLVNIPTSLSTSQQFVMNTITKAWCKFTGWDARQFISIPGKLFFIGGAYLNQAWVGSSDFGAAITCRAQQAFSYLSARGQLKHLKLLRPTISASENATVGLGVDTDFTFSAFSTSEVSTSAVGDLWDSGIWGTAVWAGGSATKRDWATVATKEAFAYSLRLLVRSSTATVGWSATDYLYETGGVL